MQRLLTAAVLAVAATAAAATPTADRFGDHIGRAAAGGLEALDFHHLMFAFEARHLLPDRGVAERALDRLAGTRPADPLMADEVRLLRAQLAVEAGRPEAARELFRAMGGLERWWAHGPMSIEELDDVQRLEPPLAGDEWRATPGTDPIGWLRLSGLAWPARRQLLYLATTVDSARDQPVALRIGASQAARAWINGDEVLTTPQPLRRAPDQHAGGAWLRRGRNLVVVAVASETDDWWLRARLSAPDGSPLDGAGEVDARPAVQARFGEPRPAVRTLEAELRQAMADAEDGAAIALASFLVARTPQPDGGADALAVCRAARAEAPGEARLLEWRLTSDERQRGELLADAVRADDGLALARVELARWLDRRGLHDEAARTLAEGPVEPALEAVGLALAAGLWGDILLPQLAEVSRSAAACQEAASLLAAIALDGSRLDLAREALGRLAVVAPGAAATLELEQRLAERCGAGDALRDLFRRQLAVDPNLVRLRVRLARLTAAAGERAAARELLEAGLERSPDDVELLMELATVEHADGDDETVRRLARRVLDLRPQERSAQRLLELLGDPAEDLGWLRDRGELWRLADAAPTTAAAVVLLDRVELRFLPSHLIEQRAQQVFLVNDSRRANELLTHTLPYVSERQRLRVLAARVLRRDGSEIGARQSDTPRLAEPEINIYYDTRLRVLRFAELVDGDLIEIAYVLSETAESNETGAYEGGIVRLGHSWPVALAEIELAGPAELLPAWELVHLDGTPQRRPEPDGAVRLAFSWRDLEPLPADVPPPPAAFAMPYLAYSNHPEWGDLAVWYERHVAARVRPSPQVEELARRFAEGTADRGELIDRIYRFVTMDIRYVGLEFGEHRFRPFSADWVLDHRIGDCKDKAALAVALYRAAGIPARMVMVRTADGGAASTRLAQLELFNHAIVYLPEDDLWLDGTAAGHAFALPPAMIQGAQVLVVDGPDSRPEITPIAGAGVRRLDYRLRRLDDRRVELEVRTEDSGEAADRRRLELAGSQDPRRLARWLQRQFPGADVVGEPKLRLIPASDPTIVELDGVVSRSALLGGGGIPTLPESVDWALALLPSGARRSPLLLPVRPDVEWRVEVELGRTPQSLPEPVAMRARFGELRIDVRPQGSGYVVEGSFRLAPGLVAAADAGQLRDFLAQAERHLSRPLEVP